MAERQSDLVVRVRRCGAAALVVAIHAGLIWMAGHLFWRTAPESAHSITVTVFAPEIRKGEFLAPPLSWKLRMPEDIEVPQPDIQINDDPTLPSGTLPGGPVQLVMPRPDPAHLNEDPALPLEFHGRFVGAKGELVILVLPDGSVADAHVVTSAGNSRLDKAAIAYVLANWRFIPAYLGMKPIEHWMQVFVRFATS